MGREVLPGRLSLAAEALRRGVVLRARAVTTAASRHGEGGTGTGLGLRGKLSARTARIWGTITHVATPHRAVALTFDDGPHPVFTPRLLTVLKRHGARATFFMVGSSAHRHPDVVRQVAADGHAIGNHSWSHPSMPLISRRERRRQVRDCADALAPYGQRLFRPPYGNQTLASRLELTWLRHAVIGWSRSARDSSTDDAGQIVARLRERIRPGDIILFHDALHDAVHERYFDRGYAVEAVDHLLRDLGGGFEFVSVPELLRLGRPRYASFFGRPDVALLNSLSTATGVPRRYADGSAGRVEPS